MADDPLIEHPTWYANIRYFFTEKDIKHMKPKLVDLATYDGVVANAPSIFAMTETGYMPMGGTRWSSNRVHTFLNWIVDKYPLGTPTAPTHTAALFQAGSTAERVRKEISTVKDGELTRLQKAFAGIMARDPKAPDSYFTIAGFHWYPAIDQNRSFRCLHHQHRFLPWHRVHLKRLEDALRTVEGCADVTLPYWDVTTLLPNVLSQPPFASYTLQAPIGHGYDGMTTGRYTAAQIAANMAQPTSVADQIDIALRQQSWELFNFNFWQAHDNGHDSIGETMGNQDVSAFDPVFWFFHCNLDRLWLQWQRSIGATTVETFKSTCREPTEWLDIPAVGVLPPFPGHAADTIAMPEIDYAPPPQGAQVMAFENKTGNVAAAQRFRIDADAPLSVRVKDIDRSGISGSFVVRLLADGKLVARQSFFQPTAPELCPSCGEQEKVFVDFRVKSSDIVGKELSVEIHVPRQQEMGTQFPLSKAGKPTINVRHLLEGE